MIRKQAVRFLRDRRGLSALEFALVAPLMITTYFGAFEMCDILLVNRKVTNVAAATADLVAQANQIADADISNIFNAATPIMSPYTLTNLQIVVSSVTPDVNGNPKVAWSETFQGTARAKGSTITLPNGVLLTGASVIVSEVTYTYQTPVGEFVTHGMTMTDKFYERPRRVAVIPRI